LSIGGGRKLQKQAASKNGFAHGSQEIVSFFNSCKKLLCNFLHELKKEKQSQVGGK
jgi:hypothetical protein